MKLEDGGETDGQDRGDRGFLESPLIAHLDAFRPESARRNPNKWLLSQGTSETAPSHIFAAHHNAAEIAVDLAIAPAARQRNTPTGETPSSSTSFAAVANDRGAVLHGASDLLGLAATRQDHHSSCSRPVLCGATKVATALQEARDMLILSCLVQPPSQTSRVVAHQLHDLCVAKCLPDIADHELEAALEEHFATHTSSMNRISHTSTLSAAAEMLRYNNSEAILVEWGHYDGDMALEWGMRVLLKSDFAIALELSGLLRCGILGKVSIEEFLILAAPLRKKAAHQPSVEHAVHSKRLAWLRKPAHLFPACLILLPEEASSIEDDIRLLTPSIVLSVIARAIIASHRLSQHCGSNRLGVSDSILPLMATSDVAALRNATRDAIPGSRFSAGYTTPTGELELPEKSPSPIPSAPPRLERFTPEGEGNSDENPTSGVTDGRMLLELSCLVKAGAIRLPRRRELLIDVDEGIMQHVCTAGVQSAVHRRLYAPRSPPSHQEEVRSPTCANVMRGRDSNPISSPERSCSRDSRQDSPAVHSSYTSAPTDISDAAVRAQLLRQQRRRSIAVAVAAASSAVSEQDGKECACYPAYSHSCDDEDGTTCTEILELVAANARNLASNASHATSSRICPSMTQERFTRSITPAPGIRNAHRSLTILLDPRAGKVQRRQPSAQNALSPVSQDIPVEVPSCGSPEDLLFSAPLAFTSAATAPPVLSGGRSNTSQSSRRVLLRKSILGVVSRTKTSFHKSIVGGSRKRHEAAQSALIDAKNSPVPSTAAPRRPAIA